MTPIAGRPILTATETRAAEAAADVNLATLMQRAGDGVATAVRRLAAGQEVLILCGPGNNGGDGYVAATALRAAGHPVRIAADDDPTTDLARAARDWWPGRIGSLAHAHPAPILVDALFGSGLSRPLAPALAGHLRRLAAAARLVIAVDLPSGVATDDGTVLTTPTPAPVHVTLALGAIKPSHLLQPAARACGMVRLIDIGLVARATAAVIATPRLADPGPDAQKYTRGMVAIVPGAMAGAGQLAATAAMRAGAGYVLLLTDTPGEPHALVRRPFAPEALADGRIGAVVIGPGLGRNDEAGRRLEAALASKRPLVIDGDALRLIDVPRLAAVATAKILTPHISLNAILFVFADDTSK